MRHPFWSGKRDSSPLRGHSRDINVTPSPLCGGPLGGPGSLVQRLFRKTKKANHKGEGTEKVPLEAS